MRIGILETFVRRISFYNFRNGSLLATTSKDKKLRVIDPRSTECLRKGDSHQGTKSSKVSNSGIQITYISGKFIRILNIF